MFDFSRPDCVDDREWQALVVLRERLERAISDEDPGLVLGTAKELCEATAKLVFLQRSERFGSNTDMSDLIAGAHRLIDRLPAVGGAAGDAVRDLAQGAMKIAKRIVELRNRAGSGHGRPEPVELDAIDARFAASAAFLWCGWVLARLDALVVHDPDRIANDIASRIFYKGDLRRRLLEAGLSSMDERDQRVVGVAVGQRGGPGGTINVWSEGILAAAEDDSLDTWPAAYREAVAEGLFFDRNGYLNLRSIHLEVALRVLAPLDDSGAAAIRAVATQAANTDLGYSVSAEDRRETEARLDELSSSVGPDLATELVALADLLRKNDE